MSIRGTSIVAGGALLLAASCSSAMDHAPMAAGAAAGAEAGGSPNQGGSSQGGMNSGGSAAGEPSAGNSGAGAAGVGGAAGEAGAGGADDGPVLEPEVGFLYWVDPSRCLTPCTGDPSPHLVYVAADGTVAESGELRFDAAAQPQLAALIAAAAAAGHVVTVGSPFRTYQTQLDLWIATTEIGRAARPGHSEHQIGTTTDLGFGSAEAQTWVADHCFEFGFALSFPPGTEKVTGIRYEAWHFRYVGIEAATEIHENGWAIVEYLIAHPELARFGDCSDCPAPESWEDCGALDAAGVCEGQVLRWCINGAAGAVDCSTTGLSCVVTATPEAVCQ